MSRFSFVKNIIAKSLGAFWIIDGLLQLQPKMFGQDFVSGVLAPNLAGQPGFLHATIIFGIFLWNIKPILANTAAAILQIAIGILLLFPVASKKFKAGLYISIVWGLIIWIFGEGAGLLLTGSASFYTGAPGSALIYVFIAALLLLPEETGLAWFPKIAGGLLLLGSALQLQPVFWTSGGIQSSVMASTMESLHILSLLPVYVSTILSLNPVLGNLFLICVPLAIGLMLLVKPNRVTATIAVVFLFFAWWLGQDFGMLTTLVAGTSTDPNVAPLLILMIVPLFFNYGQNPYPQKNPEQSNGVIADFYHNNKDGLIKWLLFIAIILAAIIIVQNAPVKKPLSMGPGGMAPMGMMVKTYPVGAGEPLPTVDFSVTQDPAAMGGFDVHIITTNFTWTPQNVNQAPVAGQGHAHLYIDGILSVVYGPWYHIDNLSKGKHTLVVTLAANDHSIYTLNGAYIEKQEIITQK